MNLIQTGLITLSGLPLVATLLLGYQLMRNGQGALGKPTIQPLFFYAAKLCISLLMSILCFVSIKPDAFWVFPWLIQDEIPEVQKLLSLVFLLGGNLLLISGYINLSIFTRVGLPKSKHALETKGVYRISRNPMYTSFLFFSASCFLLVPSLLIVAMILYNAITHHFIILNEENYLARTFHTQFLDYKNKTARYL